MSRNNIEIVRAAFRAFERGDMDGILSICDEIGVEVGKSHVLLSLAELDLIGRDPDGARRRAEEVLELAERSNESATLGEAHQMLGTIAESIGQEGTADREFGVVLIERGREVGGRSALALKPEFWELRR